MDLSRLIRRADCEWELPQRDAMRVPGILFADEALIRALDDKVCVQLGNVAALPGIVRAAYAMPDAHWGYGFPIGGVAAFDPDEGVVSAGGVGFDISCGVRTLTTGLTADDIAPLKKALAEALFDAIPAGVGSTGALSLASADMDAMLNGGARWAVARGYGTSDDLERTEERGQMAGADPRCVSVAAKRRQRDEMGTLGSGNHYLEVQRVTAIHDRAAARAFGVAVGDVVVSIHCGSRGLGHQIGTEFLREMALTAGAAGIVLPDRELACAPIRSAIGERYLGAMRAAINCALANRQILTHLTREVFRALSAAGAARRSLRRLAQHVQGGDTRRRRRAPAPFRPSQGRDAGLRPRSRGAAARAARGGAAGADRREHGHGVVHPRGNARGHGSRIRLRVPRRGPQHEPAPRRRADGRGAASSTSSPGAAC